MDSSEALIGLLDRLAEARQVGAPMGPKPNANPGNEPGLGRARLGVTVLRGQGLGPFQARVNHWPPRLPTQRGATLLDAHIQRAFALLKEFRAAHESKADPHFLGILLRAVSRDAIYTFDAAAKSRGEAPGFNVDEARCLSDLERLLRAMHGQDSPSDFELAHAMDALIVQLVRLTGP